jgi:hypothetical protein
LHWDHPSLVSNQAEKEESQLRIKKGLAIIRFWEGIMVKKFLTVVIALIMTFGLTQQALALEISVSNNVYEFEAGAFEAADGWYVGEITVRWNGNGNNRADVTWTGNKGEVIVTPYTVVDNKQREGKLGVKIKQTNEEQTVLFALTKVNKQKLYTTVVVPALYDRPI